jgi:mRNA-degrading endonuclease YafQ of YafQ-DinJ toxin-antitoxin module
VYNITYTQDYLKRATRFFKKHPDLFNRYGKTIALLKQDPYHPSLRLHKLVGKYAGLYSISITFQYRITIDFIIEDEEIIPVNIGAHEEVY